MNDYIGRLVKQFESGTKGSLALGSCGNDWGLSCGSYQLTLRWGNCIWFLEKYYPKEATKLYFNKKPDIAQKTWPGKEYCSSPEEVKAVWMECYNKDTETFIYNEHQYIKAMYYDKLLAVSPIQPINRAEQECMWSGAVHKGYTGMLNILKSVLLTGCSRDKLFDTIYDYRYEIDKFARYGTGKSSEREVLRPYLSKPILEEGNMGKYKVCLDAGHYGKYNQGVVKTYYESEVMWRLHKMVGNALSKMGIDVIYTRDDPTKDLGTIDRGNKAKGCDLLISFHSNAADSESVDYPVSIVQSKDNKISGRSADIGLRLATVVQDVMKTKQSARNMTRLTDDKSKEWYGVLRGADTVGVPAIILENSFHTNKAAANWLLNDSNLNKLADAQAKCIADFLNGIKKNNSLPTSILKKGSKSEDVRFLQEQLNKFGYGLTVDGDFGAKTEAAVREFQAKKGLVVDGVVGVKTWVALA